MDESLEYLNKQIELLKTQMSQLFSELALKEDRLCKLEEKQRKKNKKDISNDLKFREFKENFLRSEPNNRTDPFTNEELVLWFVYCKYNHNNKNLERVNTFEELYKRCKAIEIVIEHFKEMWKNQPEVGEDLIDERARLKAKIYLEYMAYAVEFTKTEKNHYTVCSQWALNQFAHEIGSWQQIKNISDKEITE